MNAEHRDGRAVITVFQESSSEHLSSGNEASDPAAHPIMSSLGLTACRGILQQHRGKISWQPRKNAGIEIRVEIPVIPVPERLSVAGVQVMWQPQPSA
jgi:hypothetical protein